MIRFPVVLLDYDGTLADTQPTILRCLREAFMAGGYGSPADEALVHELTKGETLEALFLSLVPGGDAVSAGAFVREYRSRYPRIDLETTELFAGVVPTLEALKAQGVALAVLSNKHAPFVWASIERFALERFFEGVMASEPGQPHKPDPRVLSERVRAVFPDAALSDFLMVGDTSADLMFARNAGIAGCWARYGHGSVAECLALEPEYRIEAVTELLDVISGASA